MAPRAGDIRVPSRDVEWPLTWSWLERAAETITPRFLWYLSAWLSYFSC